MRHFKTTCIALLSAGALLTSCSNDSTTGTQEGKSTLQFNLTDAPAAYDAVYIDIQEVRVHVSNDGDTTSPNGWITLTNMNPGIYNLLDFQNGTDTLLATDEVPSGRISQVRLILGSNNSVVIDGVSNPLSTPSAQQSGLKLNVQQTLEPGVLYSFTLDFDATRSIVEKGNGTYSLKPVIRVFTAATSGAIKGYVMPTNSTSSVWAYNSVDTATAIADSVSGYFFIGGLPAGTYDVHFNAQAPFSDTTLTAISVSNGVVVDTDTTYIQ